MPHLMTVSFSLSLLPLNLRHYIDKIFEIITTFFRWFKISVSIVYTRWWVSSWQILKLPKSSISIIEIILHFYLYLNCHFCVYNLLQFIYWNKYLQLIAWYLVAINNLITINTKNQLNDGKDKTCKYRHSYYCKLF